MIYSFLLGNRLHSGVHIHQCQSALQIRSSIYFSRFHIYVLIYVICFSVSDLLHPI